MFKPRSEEVTKYALGIGFKLKGEHFIDFYESKGWMVGKSPMKDWKAAVRVWKHNSPPEALVGKKYDPDLFERRDQQLDAIREREALRIHGGMK